MDEASKPGGQLDLRMTISRREGFPGVRCTDLSADEAESGNGRESGKMRGGWGGRRERARKAQVT